MKICDACGNKLESVDIYCSMCGTYYHDVMTKKTIENMTEILINQLGYLERHKINNPIPIPIDYNYETSPTVENLRNLKLDNLADKLISLMHMGAGVHEGTVNSDTLIEAKPVGNGFVSVIEVIIGTDNVRLPIYTDNEGLTISLATLIKLVVVSSAGGLMKSKYTPIQSEDSK